MEVLMTKKEILKTTGLKAELWKQVEKDAGFEPGKHNTYKASELEILRKTLDKKFGKKAMWKLWKKEA